MKALFLNATILFAFFSCSALFAEKGVLVEKQAMELKTLDGTRILLYEDSTWQFKDPKHQEIEKDFTVPIGGGRIILISKDQRWGRALRGGHWKR